MANDFQNTSLVAREAVLAFENALQMGQKVDRQLEEKQVFSGVGATVNVRRPVMFTSSDGEETTVGQISSIEEALVPVTVDKFKKVVFAVGSADLTLKIEDARTRYIIPAMQELAQQVESDLADTYKNVYNFVGTPGTTPATQAVVNAAKQKLDELGVPAAERYAYYDPAAANALATALASVFPESIAKVAIEQAMIRRYSGFDIFMNQSLKSHTTGTYTTGSTPLVNGANQNTLYENVKNTDTQSLITDGWAASTLVLKEGDVFTLAEVYAVNRRTRESTGVLAQFVVRADATSDGSGNATLSISPPIITSGPYQTVTAAPADGAVLTPVTGTEATAYRQNLAFHRNAITLVTVPLDVSGNENGAKVATEKYKGISIRVIRQFNALSAKTTYRFDILYGIKVQNAGFAVRTTG
jgi:hypothetical protein